MRAIGLMLAMVLGATTARAEGGDVAGNGGDGFSVGDAVRLFDDVEFAEDFVPGDRPEYRQYLAPQISRLRNELKLPAFAKILEDSLRGRTTLWHFVHVRLRDVADEGSTNVVVLAYNRIQIAVNRDNLVQIDRAAFDAMDPGARARLFLHETLWTGLDGQVGPHGDVVRQLVALIARDSLPPRPNFINFVREIVGDHPLTPLLAALNEDASSEGAPRAGCKSDLGGRFVSSGGGCKDITSELVWSKLRADEDTGVLATFAGRAHGDHSDYRDSWGDEPRGYVNTIFCQELRDGGYSDWRTPLAREVFTLDPESVAGALLATANAAQADYLWLVDESYRLPDGAKNRHAEVYLRTLDLAAFDVIPYAPAGISAEFETSGGGTVARPVFVAGPAGPAGNAVACVRGGPHP